MVTHPSTNPIRWSWTPWTRLLDHRSIHRFPNPRVRQDLVPWTRRQCKHTSLAQFKSITILQLRISYEKFPNQIRPRESIVKKCTVRKIRATYSGAHWIPIFFGFLGWWGGEWQINHQNTVKVTPIKIVLFPPLCNKASWYKNKTIFEITLWPFTC